MSGLRWIHFLPYHDRKVSELEKDVKAHVDYVDNELTRLACFEVLEELAQYLIHRYPEIFRLDGNTLQNLVTKEAFQYPAANPTEAMVTAAKLVQDDLAVMIENDGTVCLPGFWRLKEKFRTSLDTLHIEAGVLHYQEKLQKSMDIFFKNQNLKALSSETTMGVQNSDQVASWATADSTNLLVEGIHFWSERQSLRQLPKSGALLFKVRTHFTPVTVIAQEPHVPGRLAEAIRNWDDTMSYYMGKKQWEAILLPYLDKMHRKQVESGVFRRISGGHVSILRRNDRRASVAMTTTIVG